MFTVIGSGPSSKMLAKALKCKRNNPAADIALNWGLSREKIHRVANFPKQLNHPDKIKQYANKFQQNQRIRDYGLRVPKASRRWENLQFPMIGRKDFHSQGKDMVFIESEEDIVPMDYYIEYVPIKKERRYHVVKGNVIAASYKYGGETEGKGEYCRNFKTGWRFSEYKPEPKLATVAKKAVDALGLDFGAVDLIIGEDNKIYVLEVNTAPGLIEKRAECYAEAFRGNYPKVDYDSSILDQMNEDEENGYDPLEAYHGSRTQGPRMFRIYRTTYEFADIEAEDMEDANRIRDDIRDGEDDASWEFSDEDYTALEEI